MIFDMQLWREIGEPNARYMRMVRAVAVEVQGAAQVTEAATAAVKRFGPYLHAGDVVRVEPFYRTDIGPGLTKAMTVPRCFRNLHAN